MPMKGDGLDQYRREYNQMLLDKATGANGIMQEKYLTVSVVKKRCGGGENVFSPALALTCRHILQRSVPSVWN